MDMQNVAKLDIPEGEVRTIHDKDGNLIWGKVSYGVKYKGDTTQNGTPTPSAPVPVNTVTGESTLTISDGTNTQSYEVNLGKNLAKITNGTYSYSTAGQTFTLANGSITTTRTDGTKQGGCINIATGGTGQWGSADGVNSRLTENGGTYSASIWVDGTRTAGTGATSFVAVYVYKMNAAGTRSTAATVSLENDASTKTVSFSLASDEYVCLVGFYSQYVTYENLKVNVQLEKGSSGTQFAPYFTPIELCKIGTYQDYIYKSGDKWYVHKAILKTTFEDDTGWAWDSSVPRVSYNTSNMHIVLPPNQQTAAYGYSNKYIAGSFEYVYTNKNNGFALSPSGYLSCVDKSWTSEAQAKSTIAGTTFYLALASAYVTDTEITNATLVGQLEAVEQWLARYGYNATVSGNLPIIIDRTAL